MVVSHAFGEFWSVNHADESIIQGVTLQYCLVVIQLCWCCLVLEISHVVKNRSCIPSLARLLKTNNNANKNKPLKAMDWNSKHTQTLLYINKHKYTCLYVCLFLCLANIMQSPNRRNSCLLLWSAQCMHNPIACHVKVDIPKMLFLEY